MWEVDETKPWIAKQRPEYAKPYDKLILLHDNARPHVAEPVKKYIYTGHELGSLTSSAIFTGHIIVRLSFVSSHSELFVIRAFQVF